MTWKDNLRIDIPEIDRQHEALFNITDEFFRASIMGRGEEDVMRTLSFLASYTIEHFEAEERLMLRISYPYYDTHKAQHDAMRRRVDELIQEMTASKASAPVVKKVNDTVTAWLVSHIKGFDMDIKKYF